MSNHVHLLVEEPALSDERIAEAEVLRRVGVLNGCGAERELAFWLQHFREEAKNPSAAEELLNRYRARMGDVFSVHAGSEIPIRAVV